MSSVPWTFQKINPTVVYTFPPGKYFIGDITYVLNEDMYENVYGRYAYLNGLYTSEIGQFLVSSTYYDSGTFLGSDGSQYGVDSGNIGIVSENLILDETRLGNIYTVTDTLTINMNDGVFTFIAGDFELIVNTRDWDIDSDASNDTSDDGGPC